MDKDSIKKNNILFLLSEKVKSAKIKIHNALYCTVEDYELNPTDINRFNSENKKYVIIDNIKISRKKMKKLYSDLTILEICCDIEKKSKFIKKSNIHIPFILKFNNNFWSDFQNIINKVKKY